jgi:hypothetical protein
MHMTVPFGRSTGTVRLPQNEQLITSPGSVPKVNSLPSASPTLSSAIMSRQISTHSSQISAVGPEMSFITSCCDLLQKEQRRISGHGTAAGGAFLFQIGTIVIRLACRLTVGRSAASRASVASGPSESEGGESAATPC